MIIIDYESLKHQILVILDNYDCQKNITLIRYNQLLTPFCGSK